MLIIPVLGLGGEHTPDIMRAMAPNLRTIADFAADHGVEILIETGLGAVHRDADQFLCVRELAGAENIYANVDPSNG